jgi:hypothetical protein
LSWNNKRWKEEIAMYLEQWRDSHALPIKLSTSKRIKAITPFAAIGEWLYTIATKIVPKRWRSNPN